MRLLVLALLANARVGVTLVVALLVVAPAGAIVSTVELDMSGAGGNAAIALGTDGLPIIAYGGNFSHVAVDGDLEVVHCGNIDCSVDNTATTLDGTGAVSHFSMAIGSDGLPIISYLDRISEDLKVAHCGNISCTTGNTVTVVDSAGRVGGYTSITVGTDGLPVISYYDFANLDLKLAKCGSLSCSTGNTITTVDDGGGGSEIAPSGDVGYWTSIRVGSDGLPVISYTSLVGRDLVVAHCGNPACTTGKSLTTVDSAGDTGMNTSLAIGVDGLPVISYRNIDPPSNLRVAHCGSVDCSVGNTLTTLDIDVDYYYTSIVIGPDGMPIISYDSSAGYLKVAHCGNVACSGGNTVAASAAGLYVNSLTIGADGLPIVAYFDGADPPDGIPFFELQVAHCSDVYCDNCPSEVPSWWSSLIDALQTGDSDCDGYPDTVATGSRAPESFIGTNSLIGCAATGLASGTPGGGANDEPLPDVWPVDFDDNQMVDGADVLKFGVPFLSSAPGPPYAVRFDFNGDGFINGADVLQFGVFFLKRCDP